MTIIKTTADSGWVKVFEQLFRDRDRFLNWEMNIKGKKRLFHKDEIVFFLGNMRCVLTEEGWSFYV